MLATDWQMTDGFAVAHARAPAVCAFFLRVAFVRQRIAPVNAPVVFLFPLHCGT
jgi:hypothetical protein